MYTLEELKTLHQQATPQCAMNISKLIKGLEEAKRYYSDLYYTGKSPISDKDYDMYVVDFLQQLDPTNSVLDEVGAVGVQEKVKLPYPCGSLLNMKPPEIDKWMSFIFKAREVPADKLVGTQKLDGISNLVIYKYGKLVRAYKRGNGIIGHDVTPHVKAMPSVPKTLTGSIAELPIFAVRGEAVMAESTFITKYKENETREGYRAARNMVAGQFTHKTVPIDIMKDIDLVVYEVKDGIRLNKDAQLELLGELGFKVALTVQIPLNKVNEDYLTDILNSMRKESAYLMDGVVLDVNSKDFQEEAGFETSTIKPKYARAFKTYDDGDLYETDVIGFDWNVSKNGLVKPRVQLKEIDIKGVKVNWASGKNARRLLDWNIGLGSRVVIIRSGDVIPDILSVPKEVTPILPTECPSCGEKLKWTINAQEEKVDLICTNEDCTGRVYKRILAFFRGIGVEGFNTGIAQKCIDAGYDSVDSIIRMTKDDYLSVDGVQERGATKLYNNMQKAFQSVTMPTLMHSAGYFGRSLGSSKLQRIFEAFGSEKLYQLSSLDKEIIKGEVETLSDFQEKTATMFANGLGRFYGWWKDNKSFFNIVEKEKVVASSSLLEGQVVLFTGFRDGDLEKKIVENGGEITSNFSKKVTILVTKDVNSTSGKVKKARTLGISIKAKDNFITELN